MKPPCMELETYLRENVEFYPEVLKGEELKDVFVRLHGADKVREMDKIYESIHSSAEHNRARWEFMTETGLYSDWLRNEFSPVKESLAYVSSKIGKERNILDLGAGCGLNLVWLAMQNPNAKIIGVDFIKKFIEETKKRAEKYQVKNCEAILADMTFLPFPDESFDLVVAANSLHEFQTDYEGAVGSFRIALPDALRVIKKGGRITGTLPVDEESFYYVQYDLKYILNELGATELTQEKTAHPNTWKMTSFFTAKKK